MYEISGRVDSPFSLEKLLHEGPAAREGQRSMRKIGDTNLSKEVIHYIEQNKYCQLRHTLENMPLKLDVFFLPSALVQTPETAQDVYIVIDLIRATTCMAVILDGGAKRIYVAGTIEQARSARERYPQRLLCGERNVKPLPGFDYGNSPVQFSQSDLCARELIMTTTNGTRAFHACPPDALRLAGSLYNAGAVTSKALELATARQVNLHLVCSGERDRFGLDDAVCAGYLARELQRQVGQLGQTLQVNDSVKAALALYATFEPPRLLEQCNAAREVIEGGLPDDPLFCLRTNISQSVGMVVGQEAETDLLVIERA